MSLRIQWRSAGGAVLLGLALLSGCTEEVAEEEAPLRPVRVHGVQIMEGGQFIRFSAESRAISEVRLSFEVAGLLQELKVKPGDRVKKGDNLARLDPRSYDIGLREAQAVLKKARAEERQASADLRRAETLIRESNISRGDYDKIETKVDTARATASLEANRVEQAQRQRDNTELAAPFDGTVASVSVEQSENLAAGQQVLVLNAAGNLEVEVDLPERFVTRVKEGDPVLVRFNAIEGEEFAARVTEVGGAAGGLTYAVVARLRKFDARIRPGMAAEVAFRFVGARKGGGPLAIVPTHAVQNDTAGNYVFVYEDDPEVVGQGRVRRRAVQIGGLRPDGIEVLSGLLGGDRVVIAGSSRLRDGQSVLSPQEL